MSDAAERDESRRKNVGPITFFREVRAEARKITWATRQEVTVSTIMVIVLSIIAALFFFFVDTVIGWAVQLILRFTSGS